MEKGGGVRINLISIEMLAELSANQKIGFILNEVKHGNVLVLEQGLTAEEEAELIKTTMSSIDQDTFIGIEMQSYSREDVRKGSWLDKLLRRKQPPRMSVIGPAALLRTVHKDGNVIQAMILTHDTIVDEEDKKEDSTLPPPPPPVADEGQQPPPPGPDDMPAEPQAGTKEGEV
jgi:hypothetical protein